MGKLNLLIGSNGCGKTKYIYDLFLNNSRNKDGTLNFNKKFYLIVPEQDTASKQKDLMNYMNNFGSGILNIDVISFDRLAYMVFDEVLYDFNDKFVVLDDVKTLLIRLAIINLKKQNYRFNYFDKNLNEIGFYEKLTSCFSEFYSYGIDKNILNKFLENLTDESKYKLIKQKIKELSVVYEEFLRLLENKKFLIKEDKLNKLSEYIKKSKLFVNSTVAFDGFTGFIPIQKKIFENILLNSDETYITVCYREKEYKNINKPNDFDTFNLSKIFINDLNNIARELNIDVSTDCIKDMSSKKYREKSDLKFIEENLFSYDYKKTNIAVNNFKVSYMKNINVEVDYLISKIFELTKFQGYKYNDIKVVVPNLDEYRDLLLRKFSDSNIPLFIDFKYDIYTSPIIEAVSSLIEIITSNFSEESVLRYINCGLFDKNINDIYFKIDNAVRKYGVDNYNKSKFVFRNKSKYIKERNSEKTVFYDDTEVNIEIIEKEYEKIFKNIIELYDYYKNKNFKDTISGFVNSIVKFISDEDIVNKYNLFLDEIKRKNGESSSDYKLMADDSKILFRIFDLLYLISKNDNSNLNTSEDEIPIYEFNKLLDLSIENIKLTTIPFKLDQIVVGDLMRSRFDNPMVLFFLGMNDSKVPGAISDNNIINDELRELFKEKLSVELSQTTKETTINTKFYVYLALTNPTDKLYISYVTKNSDGEMDFKSNVIKDIESMFDSINEASFEEYVDFDDIDIYTIDRAKQVLAYNFLNYKNLSNNIEFDKLSKNDLKKYQITAFLYNFLNKKFDSFHEYSSLINNNEKLYNDSDKLNINLTTSLIGDKFKASATAIENYSNCPYKYFAERTLGLKNREVYGVKSLDIGNIFHYFMKWFFDYLADKNIDLLKIDNYELINIINEGIGYVSPNIEKFDMEDKYNSFLINRLKDIIFISIQSMKYQLSLSKQPTLYFTEYDKVNMKLNDNINIIGVIDKAEFYTFENDDNIYVKIIDYKSSNKEININLIKNGLMVQFLLYLDFCVNHIEEIEELKNKLNIKNKNVVPIGSFYSQIADKINYKEDLENIDNNIKLTGVLNNDLKVAKILDENISIVQTDKKITTKSDVLDFNSKNIFSTDEFKDIMIYIEKIVVDKLNEIKSGIIKVSPYNIGNHSVCGYCDYKDLCKNDNAYLINEDEEH